MTRSSKQKVPHHLACILDGNRRWAQQQNKKPWDGHQEGIKAVRRTVSFCLSHGIKHLSLYVFSIENLKRSNQERFRLLSLFESSIQDEWHAWKSNNIRVKFVGDRSLFPDKVARTCKKIEQETSVCNALSLYILLYYGGKQEIVAGVQCIAQQIERGELRAKDIDENYFNKALWMEGAPPVDLVIRTGSRQRLSNFMLFHLAYSELYFIDCLWPDIADSHLKQAIDHYKKQQRTFGI